MAHPKRRQSKTRTLKRRTHDKAVAPTLAVCPNCGAYYVYHTVCPTCGYYHRARSVAEEDAGVAVGVVDHRRHLVGSDDDDALVASALYHRGSRSRLHRRAYRRHDYSRLQVSLDGLHRRRATGDAQRLRHGPVMIAFIFSIYVNEKVFTRR